MSYLFEIQETVSIILNKLKLSIKIYHYYLFIFYLFAKAISGNSVQKLTRWGERKKNEK